MDEWFLGIVLLSVLFRFDAVWLLPGISWQQTIFLIHLRFLVQRFDGSMVPWFHGSMVPWFDGHLWLQRCAVSGLLSCRGCFSLRSNPPFCFALCRNRSLSDACCLLNGLNGKNSSRRIVRTIFSVYFFYSGFKISYSEYSFVTQIVISVIRIVSYISEPHVLYIYLTCE